MRTVRIILIALLFGYATFASAQTTGIQSGFAVVTVQAGNSAGIVPVETLIHNGFGVNTSTELSPTPLLTNSAIIVNTGISLNASTGLAIVNPTTTTGHVQLSITDPVGAPILNQTITIVARGQLSRFINELFAGQITTATPATGLLTVTADVPVGIVALTFRDDGIGNSPLVSLSSPLPLSATTFTPVPTAVSTTGTTTSFVIPGNPVTPAVLTTSAVATQTNLNTNTVGGGASFVFPQVATGGGWSTELTIANTSSAIQSLRIDFFDPNGVALQSITGITIAPRGLYNVVR